MPRLFHYTTASSLVRILDARTIKPSGVFMPGEVPVVWCSFREPWEPSASFHPAVTFEDLADIDTPCRIEIDPAAAPFDWAVWREAANVGWRTRRRLKRAAKRAGANIADWRMSVEPIGVDDWICVECFVDGAWRNAADYVNPAAKD